MIHGSTASDRDLKAAAASTASHATTLHWWARPYAFTYFFLVPLFVICALLPDEMFLTWKHAQNFVSQDAFLVGLAALGSFAVAAQLFSRIGRSHGPLYGIESGRPIAQAQYRTLVYCILCITLAAYALLLGPAIRNPDLAAAVYEGAIGSTEMRDRLGQVPGISSFVNLGPLYVTMLLSQAPLTGTRLSRFDKAMFLFFLFVVVARVFLWSERLALVEVLSPIAVIGLASKSRYRLLVAALPFAGVLALGLYFGITEYFRSWIQFYSDTGISLAEFVSMRLLGYYATAINNGALIFTVFEPLFTPSYTAEWAFKLPWLSALGFDPTAPQGDTLEIVFGSFANAEFNNLSGVFAPINDFGIYGGLGIWALLGAFTGRLYVGAINRRLMCLLLFPTWMTGVYEILRVFYWGATRYFPILVVVPLVSWLLARSAVRRPRPYRYTLVDRADA